MKLSNISQQTPRSALHIGLAVVALLVFLGLDLGSKEWALNNLSQARTGAAVPVCVADESGYAPMQRLRTAPVVIMQDHVELRYAENCGAAFGIGKNAPVGVRTTVFGIAAVIASIALLWMFVSGRGTPLFAWAVPLIVSGALGNLADRVRHGFVVDFVRVYASSWEYPTFNVADATIVIGIGLLLIESFRADRAAAKAAAEEKAHASKSETPADPG